MKNLLVASFLFPLFAVVVFAEDFYVGETKLSIPPPAGYVRVTPEMDAVHRLIMQMSDPMNDLIAYYISESDAPSARQGIIPLLEKTFCVKVSKQLKGMTVGAPDFSEFKNIIKHQNQQIMEAVKSQIPELFDNISKGISKEFETDVAFKLSQIIPLEPHYESDNALAYSMYIKYGVAAGGRKGDIVTAVTSTFVNTAGKVLFLYCDTPKNELEWTRSACKLWAEAVMASNPQPPARSTDGGGFNWNKVLRNGIIGAIIGALIGALIFGGRALLKKQKKAG